MDTQTVKLAALEIALAAVAAGSSEDHGRFVLTNAANTSRLVCGCFRRTSFSFHTEFRRMDGDWHSHGQVDEKAAAAWLRGAGFDKT